MAETRATHYVALFSHVDKWVHDFRAQHDPLASVVAPHITLVFPTKRLSADVLNAEVARLVRGVGKIDVTLRSAMVMPDALAAGQHAHVFLVPDEGFGRLLRLHDKLYSGLLQDELRHELPFVPHVTIGAGIELPRAKALVDDLNRADFAVALRVGCITIVKVDDATREHIHEVPLG